MLGRSFVAAAVGAAMPSLAGAGGTDDAQRAYAAELKADAALRASLLGAQDGETTVKLGGWGQFRYYLNFRDDPSNPPPAPATGHDSGFTNGFENTRTRLNATGSIMSKSLTYKVEGEFSKSTGAFGLLDAFANYMLDENWSVRGGQFKLPILREETIGDQLQLTINRSIANDIFSQKRSQAVQLGYQGDAAQVRLAVSDGLSSLNTDYTNPAEADAAVTARVDFKSGGSWKDFDQFTSWRGNPTMWILGVAGHWQHDGNTSSVASPTQQNRYMYTADFGLNGNGWNAYAAFMGRTVDPDAGGTSLTDFGALVQAGVFVTDNVELFGRWDAVIPDSDRANDDVFNTVTAGANWYVFAKSHAAKFTGDVCWFPDATTTNDLVNALAASNNVALRPSGEDNQFAVRFQFQWIF